ELGVEWNLGRRIGSVTIPSNRPSKSLASPVLKSRAKVLPDCFSTHARFRFAWATLMGLESMPVQFRDMRAPSESIVPEPQNGSSSLWPGERPDRLSSSWASLGESEISEWGAGFSTPLFLIVATSGTQAVGPSP